MDSQSVYPPNPRVLMSYHDDWIVNVLLSDGRVYSFVTEMWLEHGNDSDPGRWPRVVRVAEIFALRYANENAVTWALDRMPETEADFRKGMDALCMATSDADFYRYMRVKFPALAARAKSEAG